MRIVFKRSAEKELLSLERSLSKRILKKIKILSQNPFGLDTQKLEGDKGYRIRIGNYRVVYFIDKSNKTIVIVKIGHRREIYR